jgi:hypothetical protein
MKKARDRAVAPVSGQRKSRSDLSGRLYVNFGLGLAISPDIEILARADEFHIRLIRIS